jgi:uncharacterized membrane protein
MNTVIPASPTVPQPFPPPFLPDDALLVPYPWWRLPAELGGLFGGVDTRGTGGDVSDRSREGFRAAARDIRRLRRDLATAAPDDRRPILERAVALLAYALGLCDAERLCSGAAGLSQVANLEIEKLDIDAALAEVEANLLALADPTRGFGLIGLGVGLIVAGSVCKLVAALAE